MDGWICERGERGGEVEMGYRIGVEMSLVELNLRALLPCYTEPAISDYGRNAVKQCYG